MVDVDSEYSGAVIDRLTGSRRGVLVEMKDSHEGKVGRIDQYGIAAALYVICNAEKMLPQETPSMTVCTYGSIERDSVTVFGCIHVCVHGGILEWPALPWVVQ